MSEIPDDWVPMSEIEATSENHDGGTWFRETPHGSLEIIRVYNHKENEAIRFFKAEVPDLQHRLIDFMDGELGR